MVSTKRLKCGILEGILKHPTPDLLPREELIQPLRQIDGIQHILWHQLYSFDYYALKERSDQFDSSNVLSSQDAVVYLNSEYKPGEPLTTYCYLTKHHVHNNYPT